MDYKDYYKILGVEKTASADEIKKAYRRLARKYHPDVSKEPDAAERMSEINEANTVLSDPERRAAYDQLGDAGQFQQGGFHPPRAGRVPRGHRALADSAPTGAMVSRTVPATAASSRSCSAVARPSGAAASRTTCEAPTSTPPFT